MVQIEDKEAIEDIETITRTEGIDCVFIGPAASFLVDAEDVTQKPLTLRKYPKGGYECLLDGRECNEAAILARTY